MGLIKEFKEFALKGNVMDMAVGVVIGGAFGKIVSSLVADIIMPLIGALLGNVDFTKLAVTLRSEVVDAAGEVVKPAVNLTYGNFIQATVDFLIIALCIFFVLKGINKMSKKKEEEPAPAPAEPVVPEDIQLLREIRDELKKK